MTREKALEAALRLALEYWAHRQQRYKNRQPAWVKAAKTALGMQAARLSDKPELDALIRKAVADFKALPPDAQEAMLKAQRESWVRGEMELSRLEREEGRTTVVPRASKSFESHTPASEPAPASAMREMLCPDCARHVMADPQPTRGWFAPCGRRLTRLEECEALCAAPASAPSCCGAAFDAGLALAKAEGWCSTSDTMIAAARAKFRARADCQCGELREAATSMLDAQIISPYRGWSISKLNKAADKAREIMGLPSLRETDPVLAASLDHAEKNADELRATLKQEGLAP